MFLMQDIDQTSVCGTKENIDPLPGVLAFGFLELSIFVFVSLFYVASDLSCSLRFSLFPDVTVLLLVQFLLGDCHDQSTFFIALFVFRTVWAHL